MYVLHTLNVHTALPVFSNLDSYSVTVTPQLRSPLKNGVEVGAWGGVFVSYLLPSVTTTVSYFQSTLKSILFSKTLSSVPLP